jgi:hypothetical protein
MSQDQKTPMEPGFTDKTLNWVKLKKDALKSATGRGHSMSGFSRVSDRIVRSKCRNCGREVDVNAKPLPNETNIAGEAVALDCPRKKGD